MEQSVTRVSGKGKIARVLLVALLSLVGLTVVGVGQAAAAGVTVSSLTPATGDASGGDSIVIKGTGFGTAAGKVSVMFGSVPAASFKLNSGIQITAVSPAAAANSASTVEVVVTVSGDGGGVDTIVAVSLDSAAAEIKTIATPVTAKAGN